MTLKTVLALAWLPALALAPKLHAQDAAATAAPKAIDSFQGAWEGQELGRESDGKWSLTVAGNTMRINGPGNREWYSATFTISPDETPKRMEATITDCPMPKWVGTSSKTIYKFEDGVLTLVGNRPGFPEGPKTFEGDPESRRFVFKRPAEAPPVEKPSGGAKTVPGVGYVTDPAGDSKISGDATGLTIGIPAGDHTLDKERSNMTAPRVLQTVSGDFTAQVTIYGDYPQNASTEVGGRRPFQGAGLLLMASPETYIRLERAQVKLTQDQNVEHLSYPSWELRFEGKQLRWGNSGDGTFSAPATTLRLTRSGNKVTAAVSDNGTDFRELDPFMVKLPETVQIGVAASHNTTTPFEAEFEKYTLTLHPAK